MADTVSAEKGAIPMNGETKQTSPVPAAKDGPTMKAESNQMSSDSKEDGMSNGKTTATSNGLAVDSSSGSPKSIETVNMAMQHLAAGKRDLLISDPNAAVASLALASEFLAAHYGETAFECGETYYYYGKALLELARLESGVLGNLDEGGENAEEDDGEAAQEASPQDSEENGEKEKVSSEDTNGNAAKDQEDAKEEGEPSNLQLSWEMLELAKTIFTKQAESIGIINADDQEKQKLKDDIEGRISDTFQTLGELSVENENYPQAIEDLETCLKRRQDMMPDDSRCIAETHYQLGVAQSFNFQFDEAVASFDKAIHVLQSRIEKLKAKTESVDPSKAGDATYSRENEIKEIDSLIPEIREKVADTKDLKAEAYKKLSDKRLVEEGIKEGILGPAGDGLEVGNTDGSKAASTISSNLIKKRPAADSSPVETKKLHLDGVAVAPNPTNA